MFLDRGNQVRLGLVLIKKVTTILVFDLDLLLKSKGLIFSEGPDENKKTQENDKSCLDF